MSCPRGIQAGGTDPATHLLRETFSEQPADPSDYEPQCDGLSEADCLAAAACQPIHAFLVDACVADSLACIPGPIYLGCSGFLVCKDDVNFFCDPDVSMTYVAQRRCNPPAGMVLCSPDVDEATLERLVDSAHSTCI